MTKIYETELPCLLKQLPIQSREGWARLQRTDINEIYDLFRPIAELDPGQRFNSTFHYVLLTNY